MKLRFKKIFVALLSTLCILSLVFTPVFAEDNTGLVKIKFGTDTSRSTGDPMMNFRAFNDSDKDVSIIITTTQNFKFGHVGIAGDILVEEKDLDLSTISKDKTVISIKLPAHKYLSSGNGYFGGASYSKKDIKDNSYDIKYAIKLNDSNFNSKIIDSKEKLENYYKTADKVGTVRVNKDTHVTVDSSKEKTKEIIKDDTDKVNSTEKRVIKENKNKNNSIYILIVSLLSTIGVVGLGILIGIKKFNKSK
ncbi:hypothetical protein [Eggerthia catenaformis]